MEQTSRPRLQSFAQYYEEPNPKRSSYYRLNSTIFPQKCKRIALFGSVIILLLVIIITVTVITLSEESNPGGKIVSYYHLVKHFKKVVIQLGTHCKCFDPKIQTFVCIQNSKRVIGCFYFYFICD